MFLKKETVSDDDDEDLNVGDEERSRLALLDEVSLSLIMILYFIFYILYFIL